MKNLQTLREEIDLIDHELVTLFEKRMNTVIQVADYKKSHQISILNTAREQEVLDKCCTILKNPAFADSLCEWMKKTMELSRKEQESYLQR